MSNQLVLIFNHRLTRIQQDDACTSLGVQRIVDLPPDLKEIWRRIPPDQPAIDTHLLPIKTWRSDNASKADYVLIQGDFGATFIMVNYAFENGLTPIYSTSSRNAVEEHLPDGSISLTHNFKHVRFRNYGA